MSDILTIEELKAAADPGTYRMGLSGDIVVHGCSIGGVEITGQSGIRFDDAEVYGIQAEYMQNAALVRALVRARDGVVQ